MLLLAAWGAALGRTSLRAPSRALLTILCLALGIALFSSVERVRDATMKSFERAQVLSSGRSDLVLHAGKRDHATAAAHEEVSRLAIQRRRERRRRQSGPPDSPFEAGVTREQALIAEAVDRQMLALVKGYRDLIAARDSVSPNTWIMSHDYGVPNLRKGGFRRLGLKLTKPWIRPTFDALGCSTRSRILDDDQLRLTTSIIAALMTRFSSEIAAVSKKSPTVASA